MGIRDDLKASRSIKRIIGQDINHPDRYSSETRHMIVFDVSTEGYPAGTVGERVRVFLSDDGYERAINSEQEGKLTIVRHYYVRNGNLTFIPHRASRANIQMQMEL